VPAWGWLALLVLASFLVRLQLSRGVVAPYIFTDELTYSELAKSLAESGDRLVRGVPATGYGLVYPALIAPAYLAFDRVPDAYAAVKAINALTMSLAAVPAYLLARTVVGRWWSLGAAGLAVAVPSMAYTGTVMSENAFYPAFLAAALLLVRALERPTLGRQALLLVAVAVAYQTRTQGLALVPAVLTAPLLLAAFDRSVARLRRWWPLYAAVAALGALAVVVQAARGRSLSDLLGAYAVVGDAGYDLGEALRFLLYHWAELDLYVGVVPVAAALVLLVRVRTLDAPLRTFLAAFAALAFWVVLVVAVFAAEFAGRIFERGTFVVAPLFLIALLAWVERGAPRPARVAVPAAAIAALGILAIPFERFIDLPARADTLMLLPWWSVQDRVGLEWVAELAFALAVGFAATFALVPRRLALLLPLVVAGYFAVTFKPVWFGAHGVKASAAGALFNGIRGAPSRDWIDAAVPEGAEVAVLWTGRTDRFTVNQNEFFNRSVGPVYYVGVPTPGGIDEEQVLISEDGNIDRVDGRPLEPRYLLTDFSVEPDGRALARDEALGLTLWEVRPPLVSSRTRIDGLYPNDTWSERTVTWTRTRCRGGTLAVTLSTDGRLFDGVAQTVTASTGPRVGLDPARTSTLTTPVRSSGDTCSVRFTVDPTAVPAEVLPGSTDDRELGAHFTDFVFQSS
jgi:hypothetical protein